MSQFFIGLIIGAVWGAVATCGIAMMIVKVSDSDIGPTK